MRYLVENIWSGQSMLSAWQDLYDLVLVRWDKHTQWSPWNCILLTTDEAKSHDKLVSLDEVSWATTLPFLGERGGVVGGRGGLGGDGG